MNTEHLRYVLKIDEYKSISKAAKELYIAQPTLSRILQNIEETIGITIFSRTNKGVMVTKEGEEFLKRAGDIINEMDSFEYDYFSAEDFPKDAVNLIIDAHRSTPALEALIRFYYQKCETSKHVNIEFYEDTCDEIMSSVFNRKADIGIIHYVSSKEDEILQKCYDLNLKCLLVNDSPLCVQVSKTHPLANKDSIVIDDLREYMHICFGDENFSGINYCTNTSRFNWDLDRKRFVTNSRGVLRSFIIHTNGYYLGNNANCRLLDSQETVCIPVSDYPYTVKVACLYSKKRELTENERLYIQIFGNVFSDAGCADVEESFSYIEP